MGGKLRSYSFSYVDGAFHKDMLESVRQFDDKGNEFTFQKFDYYDDVQSGNGYVPFKSESETWNTHNDGLDADFINPLQGMDMFSDKPSALAARQVHRLVARSMQVSAPTIRAQPQRQQAVAALTIQMTNQRDCPRLWI